MNVIGKFEMEIRRRTLEGIKKQVQALDKLAAENEGSLRFPIVEEWRRGYRKALDSLLELLEHELSELVEPK